MKPDWDKLMAQFKKDSSKLIADVDCTSDGKPLCTDVGIRSFPTIKYGDPSNLQDYKGGRDFASLNKFANNLGPQCSPANLELCDGEKKKIIEEFQALSAGDLAKLIKEKEDELAKIEADYKETTNKIKASHKEATAKKEMDVEAIKESGLGLLKAVHKHAKKSKKEL